MEKEKKSKNTIKVLFVFLAILIIALIGAIIYFSQIGDLFKKEDDKIVTCACYYLDPQVKNACGDTNRAFKFNTSTGTLSDCKASCPTTALDPSKLYSTTQQDSYLTCNIKETEKPYCTSMDITTKEGLIVTGKIPPNEELTVTAIFDSTDYKDHTFLINNVPTEPDEVDGTTVTKTITELGEESTLQIKAQAINATGDTVSSIMCNRLIEITTTARAGVSGAVFDTYTSDSKTKVRSVIISAGGLKDGADTVIKMSFEGKTLILEKGFDIDPSKGRITIDEDTLYSDSNFSGSNSLNLLDQYSGDIEITVEVIQESQSLGTVISTVSLLEKDQDVDTGKEETPEDSTEQDTTDDQQDTDNTDSIDSTDQETTVTESNFTVSKSSSKSCVERVSPNNTTLFTITIKNNKESSDNIESIKDKLPLGFNYVSSSSKLNGNAVADSVFVTTTDVGQSQEVVWEPERSWSIVSGGTLTITFDAIAESSALSGENLNEVIVTPSEIPRDPSTLRASTEIIVAQDCEDADASIPQTGIFDSTIGRIAVGIVIILIGILLYNSNKGNQIANMIINSGAYRNAEMTSNRVFNPKKYFEDKILERGERERKR